MTFKSEFNICDRVWVIDLESWAVIRTVEFTTLGVRYEIAYFHDGIRQSTYVCPDEVRKEKEKP